MQFVLYSLDTGPYLEYQIIVRRTITSIWPGIAWIKYTIYAHFHYLIVRSCLEGPTNLRRIKYMFYPPSNAKLYLYKI